MRYIYVLILFFCIVLCLSAQRVEVLKKTSEPYSGNISQACERKMKHRKLEVVNHLKYFEVKRKGKVLAQIDPINIDRNSLYIWAELSPNSKMLLFNTSDQGVFVCDLKGAVKYNLGRDVHAVSWWDNRYIVGMIDVDNGVEFIKSELVVVDIKTGQRILIVTEEDIALYPCADRPYVEYFTLDNIKHTIKLRIK